MLFALELYMPSLFYLRALVRQQQWFVGSEQPESREGQRFQVGGQGSPVYVQVPFGQSHGLARTSTFGTSLTVKLISKIKQA